jgi:acyl-CoA synthetase (AMP-forming)/AMP-acid ligase II
MATRPGLIRCAHERIEWGNRDWAVAPPLRALGNRRATLVRATTAPDALIRALEIRAHGGAPAIGDDRWSTQLAASLEADLAAAEIPADAAWATFTSGSTARPRVVVRSESSWSGSHAAVSELLALTPDDVVYAPAPLVSSLSLFAAIHALSEGADIRVPVGHSLAASDLADATILHSTPFALDLALDAIEGGAPHSLRVALIGGARVAESLGDRARRARIDIIAYYGAAELSFVAVDIGDGLQPFPGVEIALRDGTVWVRSDFIASGYLASDSGPFAVDAAGWATVGDQATYDSTGRLVLGGRADGAILTAAATVIPEDVEHTLRGAPGVRDVLVLGVEHPRMGALVVAVIESTAAPADARALREYAAATLSLPQRPRAWYWTAELARTASGKLDRAAIAAAVTQGALTKL